MTDQVEQKEKRGYLSVVFAEPVEIMFRFFIGGVFIYAALPKLGDPLAFTDTVRAYQLVDDPLNAWIAIGVPILELLCAICVVLRLFYAGACTILLGMSLGFAAAIGSLWARGITINCGCFGTSDEASNYPLHIAGNIGLAILLVGMLWWEWRRLRKQR